MSTIEAIRDLTGEFPTLRREFDGRPVAYLDSAATSQTLQVVIDAMTRATTQTDARVGAPLASTRWPVEATDQFEAARRSSASRQGVEETIFTANATAALGLVAYTPGRQERR